MSSFTRPPEWQQPADRHTRLSDPVLTVRQLSRFEFSLKHIVRIDHALVFATPKGGYDAYLPPHRPTRSEIVAHRYTAVYEVDMGVHPFTGTFTLPSDNDAFEFTAEVDFSWQVLDPAGFVRSGHRDVPGLLVGMLQQAARPVSRRFPITDSASAERELLTALAPLGTLGSDAGLQVTWTLRLRRDQADIEHQRRLQAIDHSAAEQIRVAQRGAEIDTELDRRAREQDRLQIERAMAYGHRHQELALQQQHWQHQLAVQQTQHALAMQQYEAQKVAFYQWHLQQGGVQAWALHLAEHPEDTGLVMTAMRDDQLRMIQAQMELVKELLAGDNAEKFELEGPKQLALRTVTDILNQRLPGVAQNPPLIPPGPDPRSAPAPGEITEGGAEQLAPDSGGDDAEAVTEDGTPPGGQRPGLEAPYAPPPASYTPPYAPPPAPYAPSPSPYAAAQPFTGVPAAATAPQAPAPHSPYPTQPMQHTQPGGFYPPPMPAAPPAQPAGWQPPPGYGSVPTAPAQPPAAPPAVPPPPVHPPAAGTPDDEDGAGG
ncbi:hypothetical protein [Streptomyces rubradiris]|uniref:PE-PGRS family protein n=1 Tax=Streptomyces rubradiris TaxID=285531 RepID=A0ABQ3RJB5_STRRR|nr:hypothetical protein [Streptomyces rubradiris]GHH08282.1 hypothetical protein GCM10018792_29850 [Streptomyces rubradiris]GHI55954.1 hypothetical protein Srubr_58000 [Streptomyces rubradiris]